MQDAVLMIHGLGGTQDEFGPLPLRLKRAGFKVYPLVLPGHGTKPEDLNHVAMEDWLQAVAKHYDEVRAHHEAIHVIGMCLGSLLACELVKSKNHTSGKLVMLAPTVFLDGWSMPWYHAIRVLHHVFPPLRRWIRIPEEAPFGIKNARLRAIVQKRFARGDSFHYGWMPLQSIWQLDRLRTRVQTKLNTVLCKTLIIHAREDEFSTLQSAIALQNGIGSDKAEVLILENSYHMVCIDNDKELVTNSVMCFLGGENPHAISAVAP
jgi:carboxylesterase